MTTQADWHAAERFCGTRRLGGSTARLRVCGTPRASTPCRDARDPQALRTFGPSCSGCDRRRLIDGAGGGRGDHHDAHFHLGRCGCITGAGVALGCVTFRGRQRSTGSATVAPAELDAASTGRFDVLCTGMLLATAPIDKVARYESRVADNHHHVGAGRAVSSPTSFGAVGTNPCVNASDTTASRSTRPRSCAGVLCFDRSTAPSS